MLCLHICGLMFFLYVCVWVGAHLRSRLFVAACSLQWDAATIKEPIWKAAAPRTHHSTASSHAAAQMHEFDFISVWFLQPQPLIPISCHQSRCEDSDFKNKSKNMRIRLDLASCITMQKPEIWFFFFCCSSSTQKCWLHVMLDFLSLRTAECKHVSQPPGDKRRMCVWVFVSSHFLQRFFMKCFSKRIREVRSIKMLNSSTLSLRLQVSQLTAVWKKKCCNPML